MDTLSLDQIAAWSGAVGWSPAAGHALRVNTDSRQSGPGDVFVALKGDRFDGHHFVADAAAKGAAVAVVEERWSCPAGVGCPLIRVPDTLKALQSLAANFRQSLPVRVVGVTGSSGKTSTKEFTFAVLSTRMPGWCTQGNLNNHIGVPLTLLGGSRGAQMAVVEMGMNHAGEIAPLAAMAKPDLAVITNIGVAHIEYLGSREAIAREKAALAVAVPAHGTVVLSAGDEYTPLITGMCTASVVTVGFDAGDFQVVDFAAVPGGSRFGLAHEGFRVEVDLPVPGAHMAQNAAMAAAAAVSMGVPMQAAVEGLRRIQLSKGRMQVRKISGVDFLDDSYNANPDSMCAALRTLVQWPAEGRRIAVLGRMGELGIHAEEGHRRVGRFAADGTDWVIAVGAEGRWIAEETERAGCERVDWFEEVAEAASALRGQIAPGDVVLVKGSRSARMERIMEEVEGP